MARNATLTSLIDKLRAECLLSLNPAHNNQVRDTQIKLLQRTQDWLWEDFTWPHLRVERQYPIEAGQRYYDFSTDFDIDRIERIDFKSDGQWFPLGAGIDASHYAIWDSDLAVQAWPAARWRIHEGEQVEIWPISDQGQDTETGTGTLKVTGIRRLNPLVADNDRADIDDHLIVLYAAAEYLASRDKDLSRLKQSLANTRYAKLRGNLTPRRSFQMFGVGNRPVPRRAIVTRYRPPVET